jgi:hypothetical protein
VIHIPPGDLHGDRIDLDTVDVEFVEATDANIRNGLDLKDQSTKYISGLVGFSPQLGGL